MATGNDMKYATDTYGGFLNFVKYGSIAVVIVVAFVIFLIAT